MMSSVIIFGMSPAVRPISLCSGRDGFASTSRSASSDDSFADPPTIKTRKLEHTLGPECPHTRLRSLAIFIPKRCPQLLDPYHCA